MEKHSRAFALLMLFVLVISVIFARCLMAKDNVIPDNSPISNLDLNELVRRAGGTPFSPAPSPVESAKTLDVDITGKYAYVIDTGSGMVLYQKNSEDRTAPASTAKLLTALTVLKYCELDEAVTVGEEIEYMAEDASRSWLYAGNRLTVEQLLVALLLPSGNDAAYVLARYTGTKITGAPETSIQKSIDTFVGAMNESAKSVGAVSSSFITPDGYDAEGQYTTAYDLAQIARACLADETLMRIVSSYKLYQTWLDGREVTYQNSNELINPESEFYYSNAIGMKTGSSSQAGACLVSAAVIGSITYICIVMGDTEEARYTDSINIFKEIERGAWS